MKTITKLSDSKMISTRLSWLNKQNWRLLSLTHPMMSSLAMRSCIGRQPFKHMKSSNWRCKALKKRSSLFYINNLYLFGFDCMDLNVVDEIL